MLPMLLLLLPPLPTSSTLLRFKAGDGIESIVVVDAVVIVRLKGLRGWVAFIGAYTVGDLKSIDSKNRNL